MPGDVFSTAGLKLELEEKPEETIVYCSGRIVAESADGFRTKSATASSPCRAAGALPLLPGSSSISPRFHSLTAPGWVAPHRLDRRPAQKLRHGNHQPGRARRRAAEHDQT